MNKLKKSQILVLSILALLIVATPFLSPSFRSVYLYFVINFLIVVLGAEAGLLAPFFKPLEDKKQSLSFSQNTLMLTDEKGSANSATTGGSTEPTTTEDKVEEEYEGEDVGGLNGQELFAKAEAFIGNFYKQLAEHAEAEVLE